MQEFDSWREIGNCSWRKGRLQTTGRDRVDDDITFSPLLMAPPSVQVSWSRPRYGRLVLV